MADLITTADVQAVPELATLIGRADLASMISAVSELVEAYVGRPLSQATLTDELYDGTGTPRLWLLRTPVASVTTVKIDGVALDNTDNEAWTIQKPTGRLTLGPGDEDPAFGPRWPKGTLNIAVTYVGGPSATPERAKRACLALLKYAVDAVRRSGSYKSEEIGDYSYTLADIGPGGLPPSVEVWLKGLRTDVVL